MPVCRISKREVDLAQSYRGFELRKDLFERVKLLEPGFTDDDYICVEELNNVRQAYIESLVREELGESNKLAKEVVRSINEEKFLSQNLEPLLQERLTRGEKMADRIAAFGGSWTFLMIFSFFLISWMVLNAWILYEKPFDPYPFIFLNLVLSCMAVLQAPVIMMSQNRKEDKDRMRAEYDFKINLKAELEIRLLHEKLDHLSLHQNRRMLRIQELQSDYLKDIIRQLKNGDATS